VATRAGTDLRLLAEPDALTLPGVFFAELDALALSGVVCASFFFFFFFFSYQARHFKADADGFDILGAPRPLLALLASVDITALLEAASVDITTLLEADEADPITSDSEVLLTTYFRISVCEPTLCFFSADPISIDSEVLFITYFRISVCEPTLSLFLAGIFTRS
jgi:hypothetical protein